MNWNEYEIVTIALGSDLVIKLLICQLDIYILFLSIQRKSLGSNVVLDPNDFYFMG